LIFWRKNSPRPETNPVPGEKTRQNVTLPLQVVEPWPIRRKKSSKKQNRSLSFFLVENTKAHGNPAVSGKTTKSETARLNIENFKYAQMGFVLSPSGSGDSKLFTGIFFEKKITFGTYYPE
jgi:hypothetical protein